MKFNENDRVVAKIPCLDESEEVFIVDVRGKVKEYDEDAGVVLIDTGRTTITVLDDFVELEMPAEAVAVPSESPDTIVLRVLARQIENLERQRQYDKMRETAELFARIKEAG